MVLKAGECTFHHSHTVHGSYGNGSRPSPARVVLNFMKPDTRCADGSAPLLTGVPVIPEGRVIEGVEVRAIAGKPGQFSLRVPIPAWALNEGVQSFVVQAGGERIAQFTLVAGQPLDEDIRAEVSLLRAELDLLKRAFQRHVREG
ncbi:MAG: phytanoyl-CoA dioxygenase family protein [Rhodobacteraceae bacterium]|nr:phytanoyl-CoA dioxygenase family protein [Paracoccaceae bacterium]